MTNKLLDEAERFNKLATNNIELFINGVKTGIEAELNVANQSVQKLMKTYSVNDHESLRSLQNAFSKIGEAAKQLTWQTASYTLPHLQQIIGNASFYTATINTGTGFDPITKQLGLQSPAACLGRISRHVQRLERLVKQYGDKPAANPPNKNIA